MSETKERENGVKEVDIEAKEVDIEAKEVDIEAKEVDIETREDKSKDIIPHKKHNPIVAIDFDGTLCEDKYPLIGEPKWKTINYIKAMKKYYNCTLILWTCRSKDDLSNAVSWCKDRGIIFDYINENTIEHIKKYGGDTRKVYADYYIDDKGHTDEETMYCIVRDYFREEIRKEK